MQKISKDRLCTALESLQLKELESLEREAAEYPHRFSMRFQFGMRRLLQVPGGQSGPSPVKGHISLSRTGFIFLALFLAVLGMCAAAIAVGNGYRLVEKVFPRYSIIRYENAVSQEHGEYITYEMTYIPDGFKLDKESSIHVASLGETYTCYFKDKEYISMNQEYADRVNTSLNTEDAELVSMTIDGREGYYLSNRDIENFLWVEGEYSFMVIGCGIDKDTLIRIVQGVKPQEDIKD